MPTDYNSKRDNSEGVDNKSKEKRYVNQPQHHGWEELAPEIKNFWSDFSTLAYEKTGRYPRFTSGKRTPEQKVGHAHATSKHNEGRAIDIAADYEMFNILYNTPDGLGLLNRYNLGVLDETSKAAMAKTGATGPHYHIGVDPALVSRASQRYNTYKETGNLQMIGLDRDITDTEFKIYAPATQQLEEDIAVEIEKEKKKEEKEEKSESRKKVSPNKEKSFFADIKLEQQKQEKYEPFQDTPQTKVQDILSDYSSISSDVQTKLPNIPNLFREITTKDLDKMQDGGIKYKKYEDRLAEYEKKKQSNLELYEQNLEEYIQRKQNFKPKLYENYPGEMGEIAGYTYNRGEYIDPSKFKKELDKVPKQFQKYFTTEIRSNIPNMVYIGIDWDKTGSSYDANTDYYSFDNKEFEKYLNALPDTLKTAFMRGVSGYTTKFEEKEPQLIEISKPVKTQLDRDYEATQPKELTKQVTKSFYEQLPNGTYVKRTYTDVGKADTFKFQDGGEIISSYGWDYKKDGEKYLTRKTGSENWIEATGEPLKAIKQKIYNEIPYTKEDKQSDYVNNVKQLIDKGYTLDNLVEKRIGTKEGLLNLFPELSSNKKEAEKSKEGEVRFKPSNKSFENRISNDILDVDTRLKFEINLDNIKERVKLDLKNRSNNLTQNDTSEQYIPKREYEISPENLVEATRQFNENKFVVEDRFQPTKSQEESEKLTYRELSEEPSPKREYEISPENLVEATRQFNEEAQSVSEMPSSLPNLQNWQDVFNSKANEVNPPKEDENVFDIERIKLDNSIYSNQSTPTDPFGKSIKQQPSQEEIQKSIDLYNQTAEDKGLKKWEPESPFSLGDIAGTGSITDVAEGVTDLVNLGQTYLQRQSDKNNTESEAKTKSISELKAKNSETTNEDLETYTNSNPITIGENIEIKSKKYNPTGRRIYRQELIDLDNTKFGFRNRGEMQEIISKGGSVTSFYPFETKKDIERKNKYPNNATFVGIDTEGSFKTGKLEDFKNTDRVARVFTNLVDEFILEENGSVKLELRNDDNPSSPVPVVMVIEKDENGKEIKKEGSINVLTKFVKDSRNQFGPIQGGRVILKGSDGKSVLVSGSLNNIYEQFKEIRERTGKPVEIVQLDNGSYNLGLATKDNKMTSKDLAAYDNLNTSGGNFLYIIDEPLNNDSKSSITQEQKDAAYTTINNLRKFVAKTSENIPYIKDVLGDIDITKNIPDYSRFVKSPTADNFREDIIIPDYKYGMSTDDLLKEKGYMGKGIGSDPYIDCSGAVCRVMTSLGKDLGNPLNTNAQKIHNKTKEIKDPSKWKDGDIITFNTEGSKIDHIGFLVIDENTGEKFIAESSRSFQEGRIVPFEQRLDFLYDAYPNMKYYIRRFDK